MFETYQRIEFEGILFCHETHMFKKESHKLARSSLFSNLGCHLWLVALPKGTCFLLNIII
jgi:hypothetical protein